MGWLYKWACPTRKHIVDDLVGQYSTNGWEILEKGSTAYGRRLWMCMRHPQSNGGKSFVVLFLLGSSDGYWGYKDIDETMGPYQWDCPAKVLDAADPPANEWATKWRAIVRQTHAERRERAAKRRSAS